MASLNNHTELLELLLSHREINVNITNIHLHTPLILACFADHEEIVREGGETEAEFNEYDCRKLCQVPNIQINSVGDIGWTAAHWAVENDTASCLKVEK